MTPRALHTSAIARMLPRLLGAHVAGVYGYRIGEDGAGLLDRAQAASGEAATWVVSNAPPVLVARGLYGAAAELGSTARDAAASGYHDAAKLLEEQATRARAAAVAAIAGTAHDAFSAWWGGDVEPVDAAREAEKLVLLAGGALLLVAGGYVYFLTRAGTQAAVASIGRGTGAGLAGFGEGVGSSMPAAFNAIGKIL